MKEFFSEAYTTAQLVFEVCMFEASDIARKIALIRDAEEGESSIQLYLRSLRRVAGVVVLCPVPILATAIIGDLGIVVALIGMFWGVATLALMFLIAPLGLLFEALTGGIVGSGARYARFVLTILMVELTFTLFASVVPIQNNLAMVPIALVASSLLGVLTGLGVKTRFTKKIIAFSTANVLTFFILSCFLPETSIAIKSVRTNIDHWIANKIHNEQPARVREYAAPAPRYYPPREQSTPTYQENAPQNKKMTRTKIEASTLHASLASSEPIIPSVAYTVSTYGLIELALTDDSVYTGWVRLDDAENGTMLVIRQKTPGEHATVEFGNKEHITIVNEHDPRRISIQSADTLFRYIRLKGHGTFSISVE